MKKNIFLVFGVMFLIMGTVALQAQQSDEKQNDWFSEEDEGPLMFKFEPDFLTSVEFRREKIKKTRAIIDTLDISDRKRRRLLRDLYKNGISERLSKAMMAETKFDDAAEEDIEN